MSRACLTALAAIALAFAGVGFAHAQAPAIPPASSPAGSPGQAEPAPPAGPMPSETERLPPPSTDPFGEEVQFPAKTMVRMKGNATWDSAFETLVDSFKSINGYIDRAGLKRAGPPLTVYTSTDDTGFQYEAGIPIEAAPSEPPKGDIEIGTTPTGKMLKFVHRGS